MCWALSVNTGGLFYFAVDILGMQCEWDHGESRWYGKDDGVE